MDWVYVTFPLGLVLLIVGAEGLVRGGAALARRAGVSPLVVGLTVVAFGTSSPEMAVSVKAGLAGDGDIAVGNVVGSNTFNVLFILGASALIAPLVVGRQLLRQDVPVMVGVSLLPLAVAWDGVIGRVDGLVLVALLVVYTGWLIIQARREPPGESATGDVHKDNPWWLDALYVVVGLGLLVLGARWLVAGAVSFATDLGVDELIIGLTIVAAGTSLPEVATSLLAAWRGQREIAVGNVVGSNVFNLLGILGVSAAVAPGGLEVNPSVLRLDVPVMFAAALACLPVCFTGGRINRVEGALLLGGYALYTTYLVLHAKQHPLLGLFGTTLAWAVLPAVALALVASVAWSLRRPDRMPPA